MSTADSDPLDLDLFQDPEGRSFRLAGAPRWKLLGSDRVTGASRWLRPDGLVELHWPDGKRELFED